MGRRFATIATVLVVVVAGLLVAADRVAAYAAERTVAKQVKVELANRQVTTDQEPAVSVGGFPFLTQAARGRYERVTIKLHDLSQNGVTVPSLTVVATGVRATTSALINGDGQITADQVTGEALLDWSSIKQLMHFTVLDPNQVTITPASGGKIQLKAPVSFAGLNTTVVATGSLSALRGKVQVHVDDVKTEGGSFPSLALNALKSQFAVTVALPTLPYNLSITNVTTSDSGVTVSAAAQNVPISS